MPNKEYQKRLDKYGREEINKLAREYRMRNRDAVISQLEKWRYSNPEKNLLNKARQRASKIGLDFTLTLEHITIPTHCPLLGIPIFKEKGNRDNAPSLDRIDNDKGYIPDNVWVISFKANRMKNTASIEELKVFCRNGLELFNKDI